MQAMESLDMIRKLSEFEKRHCMKRADRSKEVTDRVFCIHPD